ncbi:MAG: hypothetical protein SGILL_006615, partial [Bacillariaceae sp.]
IFQSTPLTNSFDHQDEIEMKMFYSTAAPEGTVGAPQRGVTIALLMASCFLLGEFLLSSLLIDASPTVHENFLILSAFLPCDKGFALDSVARQGQENLSDFDLGVESSNGRQSRTRRGLPEEQDSSTLIGSRELKPKKGGGEKSKKGDVGLIQNIDFDPASNGKVFEKAIKLKDFAKVDPEVFEWVNVDDIQAGETACGFLHAPLGSLPNVIYPVVDVYVCVKFAVNQPAPKGNMAVHCGGPGSLTSCLNNMAVAGVMGFDNPDDYNVFAFDQRGMGRSSPSFMVDECCYNCGGSNPKAELDFTDVDSFKPFTDLLKERVSNCWAYQDFLLTSSENRVFHFLEYSGTRQLAEDIERVRSIFGDQKLSIFGVSYGTRVMGAYATIFPHNVNLMVLDGSTEADSNIVVSTEEIVESTNQRINYAIYSCDIAQARNPGACPVDARQCLNDLANMSNALPQPAKTSEYDSAYELMVLEVMETMDTYIEVCEAVAEADGDALLRIYNEVSSSQNDQEGRQLQSSYNILGKPSNGGIYGGRPVSSGSIAQDMVTAQDFSNGAYDDLHILGLELT